MKRALTLLLIFCSGLVYTENTIIAIVNNDIISLKAIESKILNANASEYKVDIVNQRIDNILQLQKAKELNVEATQNDVNLTLLDIAKNNNITIEQLRSYPEFLSLKIEVSEKITILNLQRLIQKILISLKKRF